MNNKKPMKVPLTRSAARVKAITMLTLRLPVLSIEFLSALDDESLSTLFNLHAPHFGSPQ